MSPGPSGGAARPLDKPGVWQALRAVAEHPIGESAPVIDIGTALDLLAAAVEHRGADFVYRPVWMDEAGYFSGLYANRGAPGCIVGHALALANVSVRELEAMRDDGVRDLYRRGELPVTLTLGALAVFHAAQQSQDRGRRWGDVLTCATDAAVTFLDLLPDTVFALPPS
jgi:hypothetical protein